MLIRNYYYYSIFCALVVLSFTGCSKGADDASDQSGESDKPNGINNAPVFQTMIGDQVNVEGATITPLTPIVDDANDDTLLFSASSLPAGLVIDSTTGTISGTLDVSASTGSPYNVTVTVDDQTSSTNNTASTSFGWTVTFNNPPTASILEPLTDGINLLTGESVIFNGSGVDPEDNQANLTLNYFWDFGNDVSTEKVPGAITFNTTGRHDVRLTVTDSHGKTASAYRRLYVGNIPVLDDSFGEHGRLGVNFSYSYNESIKDVAFDNTNSLIVAAQGVNPNDFDSTQYLFLGRFSSTGEQDLNFGESGGYTQERIAPLGIIGLVEGVRIDSQARILVLLGLYRSTFQVRRYLSNGSTDTSFGNNGVFEYSVAASHTASANDFRLDSAGNIYVCGSDQTNQGPTDLAVWKISPSGSLVSNFGTGGQYSYNNGGTDTGNVATANALAFSAANQLVIAGTSKTPSTQSDVILVRLNTSGSPDPAFHGDGVVTNSELGQTGYGDKLGLALTIDNAQRIIVVGTRPGVQDGIIHNLHAAWRYDSNGNLDTSFSSDGIMAYFGIHPNFGEVTGEWTSVLSDNSNGLIVGGIYRTPRGGGRAGIWFTNPLGEFDINKGNASILYYPTDGGYKFGEMNGMRYDNNGRLVVLDGGILVHRFN